jgi:DNA polymerase sigma
LDLVEVDVETFASICEGMTAEAIELEGRISIDEAKRQIFQLSVGEMRGFVGEVVPEATVKSFGSIKSDLCQARSNLDITIILPEPVDHRSVMDSLAQHLEHKPGKIKYQAKGKYPVLRYTNEHRLGLCVTVNNFLGVANSKLVKKFVALDPRVKVLCNIVKSWAKESQLAIPS